MHCPYCCFSDTKVIDSRLIAEGQQTRRRRECPACKERFTTFETAELLMPRVIKQKNNTREPFNEQKQFCMLKFCFHSENRYSIKLNVGSVYVLPILDSILTILH